jgi:hypothetical protein
VISTREILPSKVASNSLPKPSAHYPQLEAPPSCNNIHDYILLKNQLIAWIYVCRATKVDCRNLSINGKIESAAGTHYFWCNNILVVKLHKTKCFWAHALLNFPPPWLS